MHPQFKGPFRLATSGATDMDALARGEPSFDPMGGDLMRQNDGSLTIMGFDAEGERAPVALIPMRVRPKRGEGWRTADPDQEAFARWVVETLNAAAKESA
jgi:hypothetical protein